MDSPRRLAGFPGFSLTREGLLVEGFRKTLLPYRDLQVRWKAGWLEVHRSGSSKPAARLASAWDNFFPGYLVFLEMMRESAPVTASSEADGETRARRSASAGSLPLSSRH